MDWLEESFQQHPELAIFLAVALGHLVGRVPLGRGARVGLIPGTLLVGVAIGNLFDLAVPPVVANAFFILFLFAVGYKVGPQFFRGLRTSGLQQTVVALVIAGTGLAVAFVVAEVLGLDPGEGAGLLAGSLTQSAAVATATDSIGRLAVDDATKASYASLVAVGYAVTYLFGTAGAAWWVSSVLPRLFRFDLRGEAEALEHDLGAPITDAPTTPAYAAVVQRSYRLTSAALIGRSIADLEHDAAGRGHRIFAVRVRRDGVVLDAEPDLELVADDVIALTARREAIVAEHLQALGEEVDDPELLDYQIESVGAVITGHGFDDRPVGDLRRTALDRGVFVDRLTRSGVEIPLLDDTPVHAGDELFLTGPQAAVEDTARRIGHLERMTSQTDILFVSAGIVIGGLIGIPSIDAFDSTLRLTTSVGALVAGLVFGWLRSRRPTFGRVPPAAQWVFDTYAFALAIAAIGINAGPGFVDGIRSSGAPLVLGGIVVTLVPLTVGAAVACLVFRMRPPLALGAVAGGQTSTPSLAAVNETAQSEIATLGYTVPYAVSNVLLTLWGSVIVLLLS